MSSSPATVEGTAIAARFSPKLQMEPKPKTDNNGKDERHWLPADFEPGPCDVVCGRGKSCVQHPGNVQFRALVASKLPQYSKASNTKLDKSLLLTALVDQVRQACSNHHQNNTNGVSNDGTGSEGLTLRGGFVKKDTATGKWYEVGDFLAREKVSQAFRDCLHENYKSSNLSKKRKRKEHQQQMIQQGSAHQDGGSTSSKSSSPTSDVVAPPAATMEEELTHQQSQPQPPQALGQQTSSSSFSIPSNGNNSKTQLQMMPQESDVLLPSNAMEDSMFRNRPGNMLFLDLIHHFCQSFLAQNPQYARAPQSLSMDLDLIMGEVVPQVFVSLWQKGAKFWLRDEVAVQQGGGNQCGSEWREAETPRVKQAMGLIVCEILGVEAPPALLHPVPQQAQPQPHATHSARSNNLNHSQLQEAHHNESVAPSPRRLSMPLAMERGHSEQHAQLQHQQHQISRRASVVSSSSVPLPEGADPRFWSHQHHSQADPDPRMAAMDASDQINAQLAYQLHNEREQERRLSLAQQQQQQAQQQHQAQQEEAQKRLQEAQQQQEQQHAAQQRLRQAQQQLHQAQQQQLQQQRQQEAEDNLRLETLMSQYSSRTQIDLDMAQLEHVIAQACHSENVSMLQAAVQAELRLPLLQQLCRLDQYRPLSELEAELDALREKLANVTGSMTERLTLVQRIQHVKECCEREQAALQQYAPQLQQQRMLRQQMLLASNNGLTSINENVNSNAAGAVPPPSPSMVMKVLQQQQRGSTASATPAGGTMDPSHQASLVVSSNEYNQAIHPSPDSALERALRAPSMKSRGLTSHTPETVVSQKDTSATNIGTPDTPKSTTKDPTETVKTSSDTYEQASNRRLPLKKRKRLILMERNDSDSKTIVSDPPTKKQQVHGQKPETAALEALAALAAADSPPSSALSPGPAPVKSGNHTETTVSA